MTTRAVWLNPLQCLLQQCADFVVAAFAFLVQFYKEIGCGLQGLVDGARVFAVDGELLQPAYEPVEQRECFAVYIVEAYVLTSLCHKYFLQANIISASSFKVADLPIIAICCYCGISATLFLLFNISFAPKKEL